MVKKVEWMGKKREIQSCETSVREEMPEQEWGCGMDVV
jgi:hypothetical protein